MTSFTGRLKTRPGAGAGAAGALAARARPYRVIAVRSAAHLAAWTPFLYALARTLAGGWRPVSDIAVLSLRSWDALTGYGQLVGAATRLGHGVYDLGPLESWLLTVPVHLDPVHGVLWGATLWCLVAASLAIEAAWATAGELGAVVASGVILGFVGWLPRIAMLPAWNPWFGAMFFVAALAAGWAVLSGRQRWWPALVVTGSVAAQAHLMYALAMGCLLLCGFIAALADSLRQRKYRWLVTGTALGLACWAAPLGQQFAGRPGNMTELIRALHSQGTAEAGLSFGLKALSAATQPPPYWWKPTLPALHLAAIDHRAAWFGAAELGITAVALAAAILILRSRWLAALAGLSLLTAGAALETYSGVPTADLSRSPTDLSYLMTPMFPLGVLAWLTVGSVLALGAGLCLRRLRTRGAGVRAAPKIPRVVGAVTTAGRARIAGLAAVALVAVLASRAALHTGGPLASQRAARKAVASASAQIERAVPAQRIALKVVAPDGNSLRQVTMGLAYALRTAGYTPELSYDAFQLGPAYSNSGLRLRVTVFVRRHGGVRVAVTR